MSQTLRLNNDYFTQNNHRELVQSYVKLPVMYRFAKIHKVVIP